jgi:hypothetical protein
MGMFPPAKEPLPFETATDRFRDALEKFQANRTLSVVEAKAIDEAPPVKPCPVIVWETVDGKRVARRIA